MRPAGLTAVCVISLVLGGLGSLSLLCGCVNTMFQSVMMDASLGMQDWIKNLQPPQMRQQMAKQWEHQDELMQEVAAIQANWRIISIALLLILAVAAVGLIGGAIKGLNLRPRAHHWMIIGMSAGILHGLFAAYRDTGIQRETQVLTIRHMEKTLQSMPGGPNPQSRVMTSSAMQLTGTLAAVIYYGWALVKCTTYATCIWYLLTPRIRQLFEGDGSERAVIDALSDTPT